MSIEPNDKAYAGQAIYNPATLALFNIAKSAVEIPTGSNAHFEVIVGRMLVVELQDMTRRTFRTS